MLDTGKPYEKLSQAVFQSIVNQNDVGNIVVKHDVKLRGKRGKPHQIDVYWEFAVGHLEYKAVVQAKNWKKRVDQGELFKFKAILDDLPSPPRPTGIFISRAGYQEGAIDYAREHEILLYELREADDEANLILTTTGWAHYAVIRMPLRGIIGTTEDTIPKSTDAFGLVWDVFTPAFSNIHFTISASWLQSTYLTMDVSKVGQVKSPPAFLHETHLYDKDGAAVSNLAVVFRELAMAMKKEGIEQKRASHVFQQPTFIRTDSKLIPYAKVDDVSVDVKIEHKQEIRRGRVANFAHWVLRQLNSGHIDWFRAMPSVTSQLPKKNV